MSDQPSVHVRTVEVVHPQGPTAIVTGGEWGEREEGPWTVRAQFDLPGIDTHVEGIIGYERAINVAREMVQALTDFHRRNKEEAETLRAQIVRLRREYAGAEVLS